jgi:hypothetical protein
VRKQEEGRAATRMTAVQMRSGRSGCRSERAAVGSAAAAAGLCQEQDCDGSCDVTQHLQRAAPCVRMEVSWCRCRCRSQSCRGSGGRIMMLSVVISVAVRFADSVAAEEGERREERRRDRQTYARQRRGGGVPVLRLRGLWPCGRQSASQTFRNRRTPLLPAPHTPLGRQHTNLFFRLQT